MFDLENILMFIALGANLALGGLVWSNNSKEKVNRFFGYFSVITALWIASNLLFFNVYQNVHALRFVYAFGLLVLPVSIAWALLLVDRHISSAQKYTISFSTSFLFLVTIFSDKIIFGVGSAKNFNGFVLLPGNLFGVYTVFQILLFMVMVGILVVGIKTPQIEHRKRRIFVLVGVFLYGLVTITTSFLAPIFLKESAVLSYDAQSSLFLVIFSAFAILRYRLFEIKVLTTEILTFGLWTIFFLRLMISESLKDAFIEFLFLLTAIIFGIFQIRGVKREVENREKGERLARYLANANARLRELDKQKTEFVSIASHQLRSPIAAIKGYTSLVVEGTFGDVPPKLEEPLHRILESGQRIGVMVDDFLNVTRIEQGRMSYDMKPRNICDILNSVVKELKVVVEEKGLQINLDFDESKKYFVNADEGKLRQIFSNLIDNAIKYTPQGSIQVSVSSLDKEKKVLVKIKDTGIGIARDEIQNLFQKFNRASNANEENVLGTGLGLYIAREILKAHEGWVGVESEGVGKGSTFTVELPACDEGEQKV